MAGTVPKSIIPITKQDRVDSRADFTVRKFNQFVQQNGLKVVIEKAIACACRNRKSHAALSGCVNCEGLGIQFVEPTETTAIIQGVTYDMKNFQYSDESLGAAQMTVEYAYRISYFDKITLLDGESVFTESVWFNKEESGGVTLSRFLTYEPLEIEYVYKWLGESVEHEKLEQDVDYTLSGRKITLINSTNNEERIGIRYKHKPVYLVMELNHDIRNTITYEKGQFSLERLPVAAILKKMHLVSMGEA